MEHKRGISFNLFTNRNFTKTLATSNRSQFLKLSQKSIVIIMVLGFGCLLRQQTSFHRRLYFLIHIVKNQFTTTRWIRTYFIHHLALNCYFHMDYRKQRVSRPYLITSDLSQEKRHSYYEIFPCTKLSTKLFIIVMLIYSVTLDISIRHASEQRVKGK